MTRSAKNICLARKLEMDPSFCLSVILVLLVNATSTCLAFSPLHSQQSGTSLFSASVDTEASTTEASQGFSMPLSVDEMISQVSTCMSLAAADSCRRQLIRILLPRDATAGDFGKYVEEERSDIVQLVPLDESWQGGIMQLYRSAAPTAQALLQKYCGSAVGVPPRITEDRSVDESGVDGVGLLTTMYGDGTKSSSYQNIACWVQPTQELVDEYLQAGENDLVVLLNPQWRLVDDALDTASKGDGLFSSLATFLGGKGGVVKQLQEGGFKPVYTLEGYVCRGANVRLLQTYGAEWQVFCERDDGEAFVPVGAAPTRPSYQEVEGLLNKANIGFKYARDMGLEPKL